MDSIINPQTVKLFSQGDPGAFASVYNFYFPLVLNHCEKNDINQHDAEDIAITIFGQLWKQKAKLYKIRKLVKFIYLSLENEIMKYATHHALLPVTTYALQEDSMIMEHVYNELYPASEEAVALIMRAIERLEEKRKTIIKLVFFKNLNVKQIALIMGISIKTVKNLKLKALKQLRIELIKD